MWNKTNRNHPELKEGEVFLCNTGKDHSLPEWRNHTGLGEMIGWETKRIGEVAYDTEGNPIPDIFPVFVQRSELKEAGRNPDNPFNLNLDLYDYRSRNTS